MDFAEALAKFPALVAQLEASHARLAELELAARNEGYVDVEWVCTHFDISKPTAFLMLKGLKVFCYGPKIRRYKKSDVLSLAKRHTTVHPDSSL